jgi:hypothetical protein
MDLIALHVLSGLVSAVVQMAATVVVLFCIVSFFSFKPGGSTRFFFISVTYFFLSYILLFASAVTLENITGSAPVFSGVSTLFMAALIHLVYGVLIVALYIRTVVLG